MQFCEFFYSSIVILSNLPEAHTERGKQLLYFTSNRHLFDNHDRGIQPQEKCQVMPHSNLLFGTSHCTGCSDRVHTSSSKSLFQPSFLPFHLSIHPSVGWSQFSVLSHYYSRVTTSIKLREQCKNWGTKHYK